MKNEKIIARKKNNLIPNENDNLQSPHSTKE
jgi:hypothetical protein